MKLIPTFDLTDWGLCFNVFKNYSYDYEYGIDIQILCFDYEYGIDIQILCFDLLIYFKKKETVKVAVLSKYREKFYDLVEENKKPNEEYFCISSLKDTIGREFNRIKFTYKWWDLENADDILEECNRRIKSNKPK